MTIVSLVPTTFACQLFLCNAVCWTRVGLQPPKALMATSINGIAASSGESGQPSAAAQLVNVLVGVHLRLDALADRGFQVSTIWSYERQILLAKGSWEVVADAYDNAVLLGTDDDQEPTILDPSEVFEKRVFEETDGKLFMQDLASGRVPISLSQETCKLRRACCKLPVAGSGASFERACFSPTDLGPLDASLVRKMCVVSYRLLPSVMASLCGSLPLCPDQCREVAQRRGWK